MSKGEPLERRTIRAKLMRLHGWTVESHVDGWVDVKVPRSRTSANDFAKEVRSVIEELGYEPEIVIGQGGRLIRVRTSKTQEQAGRGEHGFSSSKSNG
jgi:hypothetical protein